MYIGLRKTIKDCGITISFSELADNVIGLIDVTDKNRINRKVELVINRNHSVSRKEFSIAFLFNCYLLEDSPILPATHIQEFSTKFQTVMYDNDLGVPYYDSELCNKAVRNAVYQLAPKLHLNRFVKKNGIDIDKISEHFRITKKHAKRLIKVYGINVEDELEEKNDATHVSDKKEMNIYYADG